ncbi:SUMF1/EgtB/PvdOfamily nonheme iron enzyme [Mucilaginibacter pallidiroseus]|uniref:SUMF1/EgtB/PvdOfamily nonheme iron enzyme n=1 Tax=Mucilaginibacter pallidiroseus TaxID=2599295 RepID=A0A563TWX4_9SPHI|nr:SUMF1/EgtB/PvdO family nonheme iron enzyme [Mucilaginibacter pallidiroseus]TWR23855.1 SUMF1/EgtB/PvdOfamily nonheme iron enzyme [Mucilaginibacter pallidiroseus]
MKQLYFLTALFAGIILSGCGIGSGGDRGEVTGVRGQRPFRTTIPLNMVYIKGGTFLMGQTDQDVTFSQTSQTRQVTVPPFFMDETEISNTKYKQFVNWVRDSIAITNYLNDQKYYMQPKRGAVAADANGKKFIDWKYVEKNPPFSTRNRGAAGNAQKLQGIYYQGDDRVFDRNEVDVRMLKYNYALFTLRDASNLRNDKTKRRSDFIFRDTVAVYPDTLVWLNDFSYAANEPMVEGYFSHPAYRNYPVVGVTWRQARAFTVWRTRLMEGARHARKQDANPPFMLPNEAEFEYAARGGRVGTDYPWGGPYIKNAKGCLLANFKPGRGNYTDDGGAYTVNVRSYFPNDFGLYNMAGNVAEWTLSAYDESASTFVHDLSPTFNYEAKANDPEVLKRKVVRGGSWKDVGYFLQNATRSFEYQDTAKSYIGFRCVTHYLGRDIKDKR